MREGQKFFLFIGTAYSDAAASKLKATGIPYRWKRFESRPENWSSIASIIRNPDLAGVIGKLTGHVYRLILQPTYRNGVREVLEALRNASHVIFIHEAVFSGESEEQSRDLLQWIDPDDPDIASIAREYMYPTPSIDERETVNAILEEYQINIMIYKTNAELSVLSANFIDDNERNLLFRLYVPAGRLYAAEADKLISLFRDWLSRTGRRTVRQDGYCTPAGQVYEFFGVEGTTPGELSSEFSEFSAFLALCIDDPNAAVEKLSHVGVSGRASMDIVTRYGKEGRRLQIDLKHEKESRLMGIRHRLESELVDISMEFSIPWRQIEGLIDHLGQDAQVIDPIKILAPESLAEQLDLESSKIDRRIIKAVEEVVVGSIQGADQLSILGQELLLLISRSKGSSADLESAVYEFEDSDSRVSDRLAARQRLKSFLLRRTRDLGDVKTKRYLDYLDSNEISS